MQGKNCQQYTPEKDVFRLFTSVGQRKNSHDEKSCPHEESNLWIPRSDALPLSHRDSTERVVY